MRGSVTTACPSAASVGARTTPRMSGLLDGQLVEDDRRRQGAERDGQRQPDPEQAHRHPDPAAEAAGDRCSRRRRTAPAPASPPPASARSARALEIDLSEHLGTHQQSHGDEDHRRRDRRPRQPPRDRRDPEQRERHDGECPLHSGPRARGVIPASLAATGRLPRSASLSRRSILELLVSIVSRIVDLIELEVDLVGHVHLEAAGRRGRTRPRCCLASASASDAGGPRRPRGSDAASR